MCFKKRKYPNLNIYLK
uniref:Uncharacterized protein n=1 Tax=Anguilla anguilla TaxID=7936 RepID=A0A0E9PTS0_ANGAN